MKDAHTPKDIHEHTTNRHTEKRRNKPAFHLAQTTKNPKQWTNVNAQNSNAYTLTSEARVSLQKEVTQTLALQNGKQVFDVASLFKQFPISFSNGNKQLLFQLCSGLNKGDTHPPAGLYTRKHNAHAYKQHTNTGSMTVTRWKQIPLPDDYPQPSVYRPVCLFSVCSVFLSPFLFVIVLFVVSRKRMCVRLIFTKMCSHMISLHRTPLSGVCFCLWFCVTCV